MKKFKILNPFTVTASMEHLIMACHRDDVEYSSNLSIIVGYMTEYIPNFDDVPYRLILRKQHLSEVKTCSEICKNGDCSQEFCDQQFQKALRVIVEPILPNLGGKTKNHLLILANEMPHMREIFMEFHGKIAA